MRDQWVDMPAPVVLEWLFHEDSLTRRLTRLSHDGFSVTPLFEGWQPLRADECAALNLPDGSEGWVREVYLLGHGEKWVFARSVAARAALEKDGLHMDELGTRSLGELLFSDLAFARGPCRFANTPLSGCRKRITAQDSGVVAPVSREALGILVAEVFLPTVWRAIDAASESTKERH